MKLLYIHGANASPISFNYFKERLQDYDADDFIYTAHDPIEDTLDELIDSVNEPVHVIGHSLGGVLAVGLSQARPDMVQSVFTMSAPFGGSEVASRAAMLLPFNLFFNNIHVLNPTLLRIANTGPAVPTMKLITKGGHNAFEPLPNDGVVTVKSQQALKGGKEIIFPYNHFEILLAKESIYCFNEFQNSLPS